MFLKQTTSDERFIGSSHNSYVEQRNDRWTGNINLSLRWQLPIDKQVETIKLLGSPVLH